jgi:hypothetical protein
MSMFRLQPAALALLAAGLLACGSARCAPSTFDPVIGSALLCLDHVENHYFQSYLSAAFGPAYKRQGGALWFKAEGSLWGANVTDIVISDDTSSVVFVGALTDATPEELEEAVRKAAGIAHVPMDGGRYPVRQSRPGSRIVFNNAKSKIYCARYKPVPAG